MPRKLRALRIEPQQPNHLVCRGNNRRRLFSYPRDYMRYISLLATGLLEFRCLLHAACLMGNHVHLLLTPPTVYAASCLMKRVNQRYAQVRNRERDGSGKLFEQSFDSEPIESEGHLAFSVLYINANPHSAGLRNREEYPWSTQALHAGSNGRTPLDSLIDLDSWYLGLGPTPQERASRYQTRFERYLAGEANEDFLLRAERMEPQTTSRKRLERPDGSSAAEAISHYGKKPE